MYYILCTPKSMCDLYMLGAAWIPKGVAREASRPPAKGFVGGAERKFLGIFLHPFLAVFGSRFFLWLFCGMWSFRFSTFSESSRLV